MYGTRARHGTRQSGSYTRRPKSEAAASWIAANMADKITLKESRIGEILLGTAIGVSTKAGISA